MVTSTGFAFPLDTSVSLEQGAMSVTNPLTAMAFLTLAKEGRHKVIVQTAAASALGQMVNRLCRREGIQIINIVRREAQKELLKEQGAAIVIFGVAYSMDKNRKKASPQPPVALGPISRFLLWLSRGILGMTVLALVASFLLNEIVYARVAGGLLLAYILLGLVFQVLRRKVI
jgi:hypothetical protein